MSSVLQKPGMDLADTYITFVRQNQDILRDRINDELYIEKVFNVSSSPSSSLKRVCPRGRTDLQDVLLD